MKKMMILAMTVMCALGAWAGVAQATQFLI